VTKKSNFKTFIIAMTAITFIAAIAIFIGIHALRNQSNEKEIQVPTLSYQFRTESGAAVTAEIRDDIGLKREANRINDRELHRMVNEIYRQLDYSRMIGTNSVDYVIDAIKEGIASYVGGVHVIEHISIVEFNDSGTLPPDPKRDHQIDWGW
jgi:hypothetical protein